MNLERCNILEMIYGNTKKRFSKEQTLELIDEKIAQLEGLQKEASYENRYGQDYYLIVNNTKNLLAEVLSWHDAEEFRHSVGGNPFAMYLGEESALKAYKENLTRGVTHLKVLREKVERFWTDERVVEKERSAKMPFVSMSFGEIDQDINQYVIGILEALQIHYETGERYSKDSIPQKVETRIRKSDILVIIFVKRDRIEGGGFTTPPWLMKELGIAQGTNKEVIAWVERGIDDIAGLNYQKEVIFFERHDIKEMEKATVKFLEALKEHQLI